MEGGNLQKEIASMQEEFITSTVEEHTQDNNPDNWLWEDLRQEMLTTLMCDIPSNHQDIGDQGRLIDLFK